MERNDYRYVKCHLRAFELNLQYGNERHEAQHFFFVALTHKHAGTYSLSLLSFGKLIFSNVKYVSDSLAPLSLPAS